jgi:acyl carrier protein
MEDVLLKVQEAFHTVFEVEPQSVTIDTVPDHIEKWDSMGHVALATCLEQVFGVRLDVDEVMEMENVREILRIIQSKLNPA